MIHAVDSWDKIANSVSFNLEIDAQRFGDEVDVRSMVLDFGCGYGRIANSLNGRGYMDIMGVDPCAAMVARGRVMFPRLCLIHAESSLPFADETFDAIVACAVFTCITSEEERSEATRELVRVLKSGGILHISEFCSMAGREFTSNLGICMRYSREEELKALLGQLDLIHEEVVDANTMNGSHVMSFRAFGKKPLNKPLKGDALNARALAGR